MPLESEPRSQLQPNGSKSSRSRGYSSEDLYDVVHTWSAKSAWTREDASDVRSIWSRVFATFRFAKWSKDKKLGRDCLPRAPNRDREVMKEPWFKKLKKISNALVAQGYVIPINPKFSDDPKVSASRQASKPRQTSSSPQRPTKPAEQPQSARHVMHTRSHEAAERATQPCPSNSTSEAESSSDEELPTPRARKRPHHHTVNKSSNHSDHAGLSSRLPSSGPTPSLPNSNRPLAVLSSSSAPATKPIPTGSSLVLVHKRAKLVDDSADENEELQRALPFASSLSNARLIRLEFERLAQNMRSQLESSRSTLHRIFDLVD